MPGTMSSADLVADLKASLHAAADVFTAASDADFTRMLAVSALDFGRVRPRRLLGSITLSADVAEYAAPAGLLAYQHDVWSNGKMPPPWDPSWPGQLPRVDVIDTATGRQLRLTPAPTAQMIALFGATFSFFYFAAHAISTTAADTTIQPGDRGLLLLRAQAEAMREMAIRNSGMPVQMRDGFSGQPRNGTPAALHQALLDEFERRAA